MQYQPPREHNLGHSCCGEENACVTVMEIPFGFRKWQRGIRSKELYF
jgi:hypothetical protein